MIPFLEVTNLSPAEELWRQRLEALEQARALAIDAGEKFKLDHEIDGIRARLTGAEEADQQRQSLRTSGEPMEPSVSPGTNWTKIIVALIGLAGVVFAAWLTSCNGKKEIPGPVVNPAVSVLVTDAQTGAFLEGAKVASEEHGLSKLTDSEGRCTLQLPAGLTSVRLHLTKAGYKHNQRDIALVGVSTSVSFELLPKVPDSIQPVTSFGKYGEKIVSVDVKNATLEAVLQDIAGDARLALAMGPFESSRSITMNMSGKLKIVMAEICTSHDCDWRIGEMPSGEQPVPMLFVNPRTNLPIP
jgi:hypothetical protein